jgi:hypothetical protein
MSTITHLDPLLAPQRPVVRPAPRVGNGATPRPVIVRRRAVLAVVALAVVATGVLGSRAMATEPTSGDLNVPRTVIAQPGDTIWGIARNLMPNGDITELVDVLVRMNGDQISAGQIIRIP